MDQVRHDEVLVNENLNLDSSSPGVSSDSLMGLHSEDVRRNASEKSSGSLLIKNGLIHQDSGVNLSSCGKTSGLGDGISVSSENGWNSAHKLNIENLEERIMLGNDRLRGLGKLGSYGDETGTKIDVMESKKVTMEVQKGKVEEGKDEKDSWVIDVKCRDDESFEGEQTCRICQMNSDNDLKGCFEKNDLIQLGCGCRGELAIAHLHCAEAWFKVKGNRLCEICGATVKVDLGSVDDGFMEQWTDNGLNGSALNSSERDEGCCRGQPFCNFLMASLVIAFVLPWFFRINMF